MTVQSVVKVTLPSLNNLSIVEQRWKKKTSQLTEKRALWPSQWWHPGTQPCQARPFQRICFLQWKSHSTPRYHNKERSTTVENNQAGSILCQHQFSEQNCTPLKGTSFKSKLATSQPCCNERQCKMYHSTSKLQMENAETAPQVFRLLFTSRKFLDFGCSNALVVWQGGRMIKSHWRC